MQSVACYFDDEIDKQVERELDAVKRAALFIKLNDLVVSDNYIQKNTATLIYL